MKCPNCSSADTTWKAKAEKWECNSCEERFDGKSCPHCNSQDVVWKSKAGEWECSSCEERFSNEPTENITELKVVNNKIDTLTTAETHEEIILLAELAAKYQKIEEELNEEWDENNPISGELGGDGWNEEFEQNSKEKEAWLKTVRGDTLKKKGLNTNLSFGAIWEHVYSLLNQHTQKVVGSSIDLDSFEHPDREGDVFDYFYARLDQIESKLAEISEQNGVPELIVFWHQIILKRDWYVTKNVRTWILGQFYSSGFGCEKNFSEGEKCFQSIASYDPKFAFELSKYYLLGTCSQLDKKVMWEFESFKLSLPLYYNINTDFPVNLLKSLEWLFLALKEFDPYSLCSEYLKYIDKNTSKKLFKEIQRNSSFESQYLNAIIFFTGAGGLETDNTKGWEIIQNESKRGNYYAQYSWANVLLNNATPNYAEAEKLLKSASESDYKFAKK